MRTYLAAVTLGALTLTACGSVSQVVKVDTDTFVISSHGVVGNGAASAEEVKAVQAASEYCKSRSGNLKVLSVEKVDPFFGRAPSASLKFKCNQ